MSGVLADGTQFSQTANVTEAGEWPLYVPLYFGQGAVVSWLSFANLGNSDVSGDLVWIKQSGASSTSFPQGFTNATKCIGAIYLMPSATGKAVNLSSAAVSFSGGGLGTPFSNAVSVNAGSQVVNLSPNLLNFYISKTLGTFSGQIAEPGTGIMRSFGGVILQKQNAGYGMTFGVGAASRVVLSP